MKHGYYGFTIYIFTDLDVNERGLLYQCSIKMVHWNNSNQSLNMCVSKTFRLDGGAVNFVYFSQISHN